MKYKLQSKIKDTNLRNIDTYKTSKKSKAINSDDEKEEEDEEEKYNSFKQKSYKTTSMMGKPLGLSPRKNTPQQN